MLEIVLEDLEIPMSFAFVVRAPYGTLLALRTELEKLFPDNRSFRSISKTPNLYIVRWDELSEDKQSELEAKRVARSKQFK